MGTYRQEPPASAQRSLEDIVPDGVPGDFLLLISFLWRIPPGPGAQAQADRMLGLVLDGVLSRPRA